MEFCLNTVLKKGSHKLPSEGSCAMEVAVLAAGFGWTEVQSEADLPACMCRVIGAYAIHLNDVMPDAERQKLMAFIPRLTATAGGLNVQHARAEYLVMNAARPAAVAALRAVGLHDHAARVAASVAVADMREAALAARAAISSAAWAEAEARAALSAALSAARAALLAVWAAAKAEAAVVAAGAAWAARAAAEAAETAETAAAWAEAVFDWQPYLDALDGALRIGPQAPDIDTAEIRARVRILEAV